MEVFHEIIAVFVCEERIVQFHFWDPWESSEHNVLDTRLGSRSHRDRITIATKTRGDPQNVKFSYSVVSFGFALLVIGYARHVLSSDLDVPTQRCRQRRWLNSNV
jgi:hypothetical protein